MERFSGEVFSSKAQSKQSYDDPIVLHQTSAHMHWAARSVFWGGQLTQQKYVTFCWNKPIYK